MKHSWNWILAIVVGLFIGIGAFVGGICMLIKPDGSLLQMQDLLQYFEKLPFADVLFQNYIFPGIALIIVNGIIQVVTAVLLFRNSKAGITCSMGCGIILMLWICIQFYAFPANPLSIIYFVFGAVEFVNGYWLLRKERVA